MNDGKSKGGQSMIFLSFCTSMVSVSVNSPFCAQTFQLCSGQEERQEQKCSQQSMLAFKRLPRTLPRDLLCILLMRDHVHITLPPEIQAVTLSLIPSLLLPAPLHTIYIFRAAIVYTLMML